MASHPGNFTKGDLSGKHRGEVIEVYILYVTWLLKVDGEVEGGWQKACGGYSEIFDGIRYKAGWKSKELEKLV
ncbi:hypothetical protein Hanom_Chr12g01180831 [Helianthus anomalus]